MLFFVDFEIHLPIEKWLDDGVSVEGIVLPVVEFGRVVAELHMLRDSEGRAKLYADIAHPINSTCREMIQSRVIAEYRGEQERSKQPGYVCTYDDLDGEYEESYVQVISEMNASGRSGGGYRTHSSHAPRGTHNTNHEPSSPVATQEDTERSSSDGFGAGIL